MGNSLAVRIPLAIARQASLNEGDCVALALDGDGGIVLRPTRRRYELSELVARITPKNRHRKQTGASLKARNPGEGRLVPEAGDFVWLTFDPQAGREQAGRRPALVLTPRTYNAKSGLALVCPVTNQAKGYPFEVAIPAGCGTTGVIWPIT